MDRILVATANPGKALEIVEILRDLPVSVFGLDKFPHIKSCEETGTSFPENARQKAAHYHGITGLPTLADDSGLEVDALGGAPGVHSARYAGENATDEMRISKLLEELAHTGPPPWSARFVCSVSFMDSGKETIAATGECTGEIVSDPRGTNGFGYDPVFFVPALKRTFAELTGEEKHGLSHRGRALAVFARRFRLRYF